MAIQIVGAPATGENEVVVHSDIPEIFTDPEIFGTPTGLLKAHVGLDQVDNTSDADKPLSDAAVDALALKADTSVLGDYVPETRTVAGHVLDMDVTLVKGDVGLGNVDNTSDLNKPISTATQSALDDLDDLIGTKANASHTHAQSDVTNLTSDLALKAPLASPTFTGTVSGITKAMVGLGSVDNTADTAKPVSTAQQTAISGGNTANAAMHGALAWTNDPVTTANAIPATGRISATRFRCATSGTCNSLIFSVTTAGSSLTNVWAALFDLSGTRLGINSSSQHTAFQSTGEKTITLSSGVALTAGTEYVVAFLQAGTTGATLSGTLGSSRPNQGITATTSNPRRQGISTATGLTSIGSTLDWTAYTDVGNAPTVLMKA